MDSVRPIELVISISKLTTLSLGLAAISCKGSIVSSIKHRQEKMTAILDFHVAIRLHLKNDPVRLLYHLVVALQISAPLAQKYKYSREKYLLSNAIIYIRCNRR